MSYAATIYVDAKGTTYGAKNTDQAGTKAESRTVHGNPVVCIGKWYGIQMGYRPFKDSVAYAAKKAAELA